MNQSCWTRKLQGWPGQIQRGGIDLCDFTCDCRHTKLMYGFIAALNAEIGHRRCHFEDPGHPGDASGTSEGPLAGWSQSYTSFFLACGLACGAARRPQRRSPRQRGHPPMSMCALEGEWTQGVISGFPSELQPCGPMWSASRALCLCKSLLSPFGHSVTV